MQRTGKSVVSNTRDELESAERGVRRWSTVEIQSDQWFQVETCSHTDGLPALSTYIVPDLKGALRSVKSLKANTWTELRMYARLPLYSRSGFIFEPVKSIFSTADETCMIFLESGLVLNDSSAQPSAPRSLTKVEELYRKG